MLLARRRAGTGRAPRTRLTCTNRVGAGLQQVWRGLTAGAVNAGGSAPIRRALHKVAIAALPGRVALAGALAGVGGISNADAMPAALPLAAVCWNRAAAARDEPSLAQEVEVARTVARRQGRTIARQQREHSRACGRERWYRAAFLGKFGRNFFLLSRQSKSRCEAVCMCTNSAALVPWPCVALPEVLVRFFPPCKSCAGTGAFDPPRCSSSAWARRTVHQVASRCKQSPHLSN